MHVFWSLRFQTHCKIHGFGTRGPKTIVKPRVAKNKGPRRPFGAILGPLGPLFCDPTEWPILLYFDPSERKRPAANRNANATSIYDFAQRRAAGDVRFMPFFQNKPHTVVGVSTFFGLPFGGQTPLVSRIFVAREAVFLR